MNSSRSWADLRWPSIFPKLCLAKRKSHLRHVVEHGQVKLGNAKVKAIVNLPLPLNKKQLMRFLGMASYYRRFCSNFATVIEPLTQLPSRKENFIWSGRCEKECVRGIESHVTECSSMKRIMKVCCKHYNISKFMLVLQVCLLLSIVITNPLSSFMFFIRVVSF